MPQHVGLFKNHTNVQPKERKEIENSISSHIYKSYQQCAEDCVVPIRGFSSKEKVCLTSCYSNYHRATNLHSRSFFEGVL